MNVGNFKHGSVFQLKKKRGFPSLGKQTHLIKQNYEHIYTIQALEKKKISSPLWTQYVFCCFWVLLFNMFIRNNDKPFLVCFW